MKTKMFGLLFAFWLIFSGISAQQGKHEIRGGYGVGTSNEFINGLEDMQVTDVTKAFVSGDKTFKGTFQLGYKYGLSDRFNLGLNLSYERAAATTFLDKGRVGKLKSNYYTVAGEADYIHIRREGFTFYSTAGIGAIFYNQQYVKDECTKDTADKVNFNFQISPVCVKYGDRLGFFGEIGFGYKGIFNFGMFTSF